MSGLATSQFVADAVHQLRLSGVTEGTTVVVYTDPHGREDVAAACFAAARVLGAAPVIVTVAAGNDGRGEMPEPVRRAACAADLLVDTSSRGLLHSTLQQEILASGTRILRAREPMPVLSRLAPAEGVRQIVDASAELMDSAERMQVVSAAGTDVHFDLTGRVAQRQYGYTADPGRWDHWGTALVAAAPVEDRGRGSIVLAPGDIYFLAATYGIAATEPVTISMVDGRVVSIEGGRDARRIEAALDPSRHGEDSMRISHVGWGCDSRARWDALDLYSAAGGGGADLRSYAGGVVLALGANEDLGGTNVTTAHMDLALRSCTVEIGGSRPVVDGRLTIAAVRS